MEEKKKRLHRLIELEVHRTRSDIRGAAVVKMPAQAAAIFRQIIGDQVVESLVAIHLDNRHRVIGWEEIARGTLNLVHVKLGDVFRGALLTGATAIIIGHNHASGDPTPSADDVELTAKATREGDLLGVAVLDHVVVTAGGFRSLKDGSGGVGPAVAAEKK